MKIKAKELNYNLENIKELDKIASTLADYEGISIEHVEEVLEMFERYDVFDLDSYLQDFRNIRLKTLDELKYVLFYTRTLLSKLVYQELLLKNEKDGIEVSI